MAAKECRLKHRDDLNSYFDTCEWTKSMESMSILFQFSRYTVNVVLPAQCSGSFVNSLNNMNVNEQSDDGSDVQAANEHANGSTKDIVTTTDNCETYIGGDEYTSNKSNLFLIKINQVKESMTESIKSNNFLNKCHSICSPRQAADPFYMLGIDLFCVRDLSDVFKQEGVQKTFEFSMCKPIVDQFHEILDMAASSVAKPKDHYLGRIIMGLKNLNRNRILRTTIDEFISKHVVENSRETDLWDYIMEAVQWSNFHENYFEHLNKDDLEGLSYHLARLDGQCHKGRPLLVRQFQYKQASTQCQPDLVYKASCNKLYSPPKKEVKVPFVIPQSTCSQSLSERHSALTRKYVPPEEPRERLSGADSSNNHQTSIQMETSILWQAFEVLFGMLMETKLSTEGVTSIFQPGIIIDNDKIQVVVLCMDAKMYETLQPLSDARDTVRELCKVAARRQMWCKIYIDSQYRPICDIAKVANTCYMNFS